jgi:hypothetical protein
MGARHRGHQREDWGMKERLIAFKDELMIKIITGEKIRTRRVINPQPKVMPHFEVEWKELIGTGLDSLARYCPYGQVSDHLLCREALKMSDQRNADQTHKIEYRCNGEIVPMSNWSWKNSVLPAMYMPRGLIRYAMPLSVVRVERLQDITELEAKWEGIPATDAPVDTARVNFNLFWDYINAKRGEQYTWDANPYVWVLGWEAEDVYRYDQR